jgi:hypothetical protein
MKHGMTVGDLREALKGVDDDLVVVTPGHDGSESSPGYGYEATKVKMDTHTYDDPYMKPNVQPTKVFVLSFYPPKRGS